MSKIQLHLSRVHLFFLVFSAILGVLYILYTWKQIEKEKVNNFITLCESIGASIPKDYIPQLALNSSDTGKASYRLIKNILKDIIRINKNARFAYLYTLHNGKIYFIVDSEPENSKDYSPPGQEYTEATTIDKQPFIDGKAFITPHQTDRWGTWRSALIPIKDPKTGKTIAVFGMDLNSKSWNKAIFIEMFKSVILVLMLLSLVFFLIRIQINSDSYKNEIHQRKKIEKALQISDNRNYLLNNSSRDSIYSYDTQGRFTSANKSLCDLLKLEEHQIIGRTHAELGFSEEQCKEWDDLNQQVFETNNTVITETFTSLSDGQNYYFEIVLYPIHGITGKIVGIGGSTRDITKRRMAEEKLKQSEEEILMLANAMKSINECVSITDMNDNLIFVNESFIKTYGFSETELIGQNIYLVHSANNPKEISENILPSTVKGGWEGELLNKRKDGSEFLIYLSTSVIHDSKGEPIALIGVSSDITERKKAEDLLKKSEERYRTLVNNVGEGIAYVNPDEVFAFANPITEVIFGVKNGGLVGRNLREFISAEQFAAVQVQTQARQQGQRNSYEIEFTRSDGKIRNLLITAVPQFDDNKVFLGAYGVFRDITNRKIAENTIQQKNMELQALNATKDKFFSIIAHDLKSPFNTLLGLSELLIENIHSYDESTTDTIVENLHTTTVQTHRLLENLLDWARNQQNRIDFNPQKIDLYAIASDIISLLNSSAEKKGISLVLEMDSPNYTFADSYMVNAIIRNLVNNSIKFTNPNGVVKVRAEVKGSMVVVSISDNGVGIKPENVEKLFRVDTNISQQGTSGEKGTGLGLLLCKEFVEKHGGNIWVESEIGKGSTFYFTLKKDLA